MKPDDLEAQMRAGEAYHSWRVPLEQRIIVRVDGRSFSRILSHATKPFDPAIHSIMVDVARELLQEWHAPYACTHSDEISVLLPHDVPETFLFNRSVEKLVSVSAGLASSIWAGHWSLSGPFMQGGHFDARLWLGADPEAVVDYFRWRLADAERNAAHGSAYWTLRGDGHSARDAGRRLRGLGTADLRAFVEEKSGQPFEHLPAEQRRGTGLSWESYTKEGYNPLSGETVRAQRRRIVPALVPPGADYKAFLEGIGALGAPQE